MKKRLASSLTMAALVILSSHVVAIGQDVPQGWKSLHVPGLTALAKQLGSRNDAAAKAERERLVAPNDASGEQAVLFSMPWVNPTPDAEVASVDLVYGEPGNPYGTPALLAITAGRAVK
jgi:hypothetical protein